MESIVSGALRDPRERDANGVADAPAMLETAYGWLEQRMTNREMVGRRKL